MMFALSSVGGSKSAEGSPYPPADLDRGAHIRQRIWTGGSKSRGGGPNPLGHRSEIYIWSITFYKVEVFFLNLILPFAISLVYLKF